jgi:hypothetical protein
MAANLTSHGPDHLGVSWGPAAGVGVGVREHLADVLYEAQTELQRFANLLRSDGIEALELIVGLQDWAASIPDVPGPRAAAARFQVGNPFATTPDEDEPDRCCRSASTMHACR